MDIFLLYYAICHFPSYFKLWKCSLCHNIYCLVCLFNDHIMPGWSREKHSKSMVRIHREKSKSFSDGKQGRFNRWDLCWIQLICVNRKSQRYKTLHGNIMFLKRKTKLQFAKWVQYEGKLIYKQYPSLFYGTCNPLVKYVNTSRKTPGF